MNKYISNKKIYNYHPLNIMISNKHKERCSMQKITRNAIQCKHCGDIIESKHCHDFVYCSCGCCFVDGGLDYLRRGCAHSPEEDFIDISETIEVDEKEYNQ